MKPQRFFSGNDTFGRQVELSQAINGTWFDRVYGFNGFGKGFSKWTQCDAPDFEAHGENQYTGEAIKFERPVAFWGFNKLREHIEIPNVRLPNVESS